MLSSSDSKEWKKCSTCKKPIAFGQKYYICSVSTCNGLRTGYSFCSMTCFEAHLPGARHRDAGAIEKIAPHTRSEMLEQTPEERAPEKRKVIAPGSLTLQTRTSSAAALPKDILIVASKLKDYIRAKSEMNTSGAVVDVLSDFVRARCDEAIEAARLEGRKTVLDRDFKK